MSGERARVLAAATSETAPELRAEAVQQLGVMGAHEELWQLYQKEASVDVKKRILQAMFVGGNATRLIELATERTERRAAARGDSQPRPDGIDATGDALTALYAKEKDPRSSKTIIEAFFLQNNAEQLVAIARKETDPAMRKEIVSRLSHMAIEGRARLPDGDSEQVAVVPSSKFKAGARLMKRDDPRSCVWR